MKKEIKYTVKGKEWEKARDDAFDRIKNKHRIDGFRKGKAPRNIFEKKFPGEITMEAANNMIDKKYREIIMDKDNAPVVEPKVNITKLSDDELEATFTIILAPEVKLGEYKKLKAKKEKVTVTKEEIKAKEEELLKNYAELVVKEDGKAELGDTAIIDFEGFKDGVPFDGGKAENYNLELGSKSFIPGFEEGIVGMSIGQTKDLKLTFPKDYGVDNLNGAKVTFKVTVHELKRKVIPELDKDFFEDLNMEGVTSKKELEDKLEEEIKEQKERETEQKYIDALLNEATSNMTCDIDDEIVIEEANHMYNDFLNRMKQQGLTEELYLQYAGTTKEDIIDHMKEDALKRLKNSYFLQEVIKEEKIDVTDKEVNKELDDMAKKYNLTRDDVVNYIGGEDALRFDLKVRKAIEIMKGTK
ncbi:MAG: trigger factor [Bacilli bacterium]|nr:trigger factor [Bacilli bacterium]